MEYTNTHHRLRSVIVTLLTALFLPAAQAQDITVCSDTTRVDSTTEWGQRIRLALDNLAREAAVAPYHVGISVWDLASDAPLWGYNAHKIMRPASTQKVFTAVAALDILGTGHEFRTRAYHTGHIGADSILHGDLYVVGDFDPMYSHADLKELAQDVAALPLRQIDGTIYADACMKDKDLYGNGWCWDDVPSKYEPFLCPLMVERGRTYPRFSTYSKDASFHPARHFAYVLSQELSHLGITAADSTTAAPYDMKEYPGTGTLVHTRTRTLEQVMQRMLKNSDNLHAEAMFFHLAHTATSKHCSWKDGAKQVEQTLRRAGVSTAHVEVADGSGVSLYNYASPEAQVAVLRYAYHNRDIYPALLAALPVAGVDGTLDDRMRKGNAYRNVRAKTGTLKGVIALCGYVTASNGHTLAFSILVNGVLQGSSARAFQDRVCQVLAQ